MIIREYHREDRDQCLKIFKSNLPLFFDPAEENALVRWLDAKDAGVNAYQNNTAEQFYSGCVNDQIVCCGGFYVPEEHTCVNMVWGMVSRQHHKKGYGLQLLEYRIQEAIRLYPDHAIILDTSQHTYRFFEKYGFTVSKLTPDYYGKGLDRYDMVRG